MLEKLRDQNSHKRFSVKQMETLLNKKYVQKQEKGIQTELAYMTEWFNPLYVADMNITDMLDPNLIKIDEGSSNNG